MQQTFQPTHHFSLHQLAQIWLSMGRRHSDKSPIESEPKSTTREWSNDTTLLTPLVRDGYHDSRQPSPHNQRSHSAAGQDLEGMIHSALADQLNRLSLNLEKAKAVQQGFLPQSVPTMAGIELYTVLRPATEVSGDFYDFVQSSRQDLIFSVGDVSSKGISAALLMPVICKLLRLAVRHMGDPTPQSLLSYIHEDMYSQLSNATMFATMFIGHYQMATRCLTYANAGHSPVIYRPHGGAARLIQADGTPIGLLDQSKWQNQQLTLNPGDLFLVGTDGIVEHKNSMRKMFGYDRLLTLVDQLGDEPAQAVAEAIFAELHHFAAQPNDDDQALLVLRGC